MGDHAQAGRGLAPAPDDVFPPRAFAAAALEDGRLLFTKECRFVAGAANPVALPPANLPEIAFIGRSNVGKSSLVNALTGRRMLARTSRTPGRTQQINFFVLGDRLMLLVEGAIITAHVEHDSAAAQRARSAAAALLELDRLVSNPALHSGTLPAN